MTIRSAIYLSGNEFKLYESIKPYLNDGTRTTLLEPFVGSGTVSLNCINDGLFRQCIGNDIEEWVVDLHKEMQSPYFLQRVLEVDSQYPSTKDGYLKLREDYNKLLREGVLDANSLLFNLMLRGNNNQVRYSGQGKKRKHNMPYGERNRLDPLRMLQHHNLCRNLKVLHSGFSAFLTRMDNYVEWEETTVYIDSPYTGTCATYNTGWTEQDDEVVWRHCEELVDKGAKVVMSNVFFNKGFTNQALINWCEKNKDTFDVHHLNINYNNSSSFKYEGKGTDEVLIVSK